MHVPLLHSRSLIRRCNSVQLRLDSNLLRMLLALKDHQQVAEALIELTDILGGQRILFKSNRLLAFELLDDFLTFIDLLLQLVQLITELRPLFVHL